MERRGGDWECTVNTKTLIAKMRNRWSLRCYIIHAGRTEWEPAVGHLTWWRSGWWQSLRRAVTSLRRFTTFWRPPRPSQCNVMLRQRVLSLASRTRRHYRWKEPLKNDVTWRQQNVKRCLYGWTVLSTSTVYSILWKKSWAPTCWEQWNKCSQRESPMEALLL